MTLELVDLAYYVDDRGWVYWLLFAAGPCRYFQFLPTDDPDDDEAIFGICQRSTFRRKNLTKISKARAYELVPTLERQLEHYRNRLAREAKADFAVARLRVLRSLSDETLVETLEDRGYEVKLKKLTDEQRERRARKRENERLASESEEAS